MGIIEPSTVNRLRLGAPALYPGRIMVPFETIYIDEMVAACNGGGGPLGHPRVYLNLGPAGKVECPYCSRLFVNRAMRRPLPARAAPSSEQEQRNV